MHSLQIHVYISDEKKGQYRHRDQRPEYDQDTWRLMPQSSVFDFLWEGSQLRLTTMSGYEMNGCDWVEWWAHFFSRLIG